MNKLFSAVIAAALTVGVISMVGSDRVASADGFNTGSLRGVVKDKASNEASIGATVVATSPALQGEQVVIADENGAYYITSLPPGSYTLTVYYNDATFSRSNVLVQVGKEAVVNFAIDGSAGKGETIAISGNAPIVDQGSTKVGTTITSDYTNNVPSLRTFGEVMGSAAGAQSDRYGVSFSGSTSAENTYVVEGLNTTDTGFGVLSSNLPNEFVQETEVITGGYNAEFGRAIGAIVNVVTKSGSNEFHGSVFGHLQPNALTADARTILREGTAIDRVLNQDYRYDLGAELGGPIIKDKLWFHVGFTPTVIKQTTTRIISRNIDKLDNATGLPVAGGDGIPDADPSTGFTTREELARRGIPENFKTYYFTAKLTGAISSNHQWQISGFGNPESDTQLVATIRDPNTAQLHVDKGAYDISGKWTSKFNDGRTQFDAVAGFHNGYNNQTPIDARSDVAAIRYNYSRSLYDFADLEGPAVAGCQDGGMNDPYPGIVNCPVQDYTDRGLGFLESRTNNRISAVMSLTQRVRAAGQHVFKIGMDAELSSYNSARRYTGGAFLVRTENDTTDPMNPLAGQFTLSQYLKYDPMGAVPCGLDANGDGVGDAKCSVIPRLDANTNDRSIAAYVQDQWQILPNLTINAGLRWEQQIGYVAQFLQNKVAADTGETIPEIGYELNNLIAPRIGFIYDPTQEGKSKLFGHWGRFYENIPMDMNVRSFGGETTRSTVVGVNSVGDPNNSCVLDHGAMNLTDQVLGCAPGTTKMLGGTISYVAPGMQGQYTEEMIFGGEYEILPDLTVGANYIHRTLPVVIEDMSTDGGANYFIGNPSVNYDGEANKLDQKAAMTSNETLKALYQSRASQLRAVKFFDPPTRNYDALQLTAKKRPTHNSLLQASYTYSRAKGNYPGLFSTETNQLDPNITSQYDLPDLMPNRFGPSGLDRPHNLKIDGFYQWNLKDVGVIITGMSFRAQSGLPHNTLAAHPVYGLDESYLLPRGALYRSPATEQLDVHLSYGYALNRTTRLEGFVDIFNVLNAQDEIDTDERYTDQTSLPIVGGDAADLAHAKLTDDNLRQTGTIITPNKNFGRTSVRQTPLTGQLGFRLTF
ncbi:MAG TPA: TonB-dependent receptor [Kofleriaceae bacterium]|jgi:outer membrane receptor protein involved in Fe transport